jgi:1-acyl-sn-glycerol-3-phosphate acyltransferase
MKQVFSDLRSLFLLACGTVVTLHLILFYLVVLTFADERKVRSLERRLAQMVLWAFGQRISVDAFGDLPPRARVWIFNHSSFLDAFIIAAVIPDFVRAVGAHYHFKWPLWGWLLRKRRIIPVVRSDHDRALAAIKAGEQVLSEGDALIVAPEGTRSMDGELLPFKSGAFHAAMNTGADIVVVAIEGAHQAWPRGSWRIVPSTIRIKFFYMPHQYLPGLGSVHDVRIFSRALMQARLSSQ